MTSYTFSHSKFVSRQGICPRLWLHLKQSDMKRPLLGTFPWLAPSCKHAAKKMKATQPPEEDEEVKSGPPPSSSQEDDMLKSTSSPAEFLLAQNLLDVAIVQHKRASHVLLCMAMVANDRRLSSIGQ